MALLRQLPIDFCRQRFIFPGLGDDYFTAFLQGHNPHLLY
jgi:hypothetical protein